MNNNAIMNVFSQIWERFKAIFRGREPREIHKPYRMQHSTQRVRIEDIANHFHQKQSDIIAMCAYLKLELGRNEQHKTVISREECLKLLDFIGRVFNNFND